jgi:hypothetical protein
MKADVLYHQLEGNEGNDSLPSMSYEGSVICLPAFLKAMAFAFYSLWKATDSTIQPL